MEQIKLMFFKESTKLEEMKEAMKYQGAVVDDLMSKLPADELFQDPNTGLVYKIQKPTGTFISFKEREYVRTKKATETKGSLSKKEVEDAGFKV